MSHDDPYKYYAFEYLDRAAPECDHGVTFDQATAESEKLGSREVRARWPRLDGPCPKGCGYVGIAYASYAHFIYGDW